MELAVAARKEKNLNLSRVCLEKAFNADKFRGYVEKFRFGSSWLSVDRAAGLRQAAKLLRLQVIRLQVTQSGNQANQVIQVIRLQVTQPTFYVSLVCY
jgi:hypothetical protein